MYLLNGYLPIELGIMFFQEPDEIIHYHGMLARFIPLALTTIIQ